MTNSSKLYLVNFLTSILAKCWFKFIDFLNLCMRHKALTCPWTNMVLWRGQMGTPDWVDLGVGWAESRWKVDMGVSKNMGKPPNHPFVHRVFHPFWVFSPYFWTHPYGLGSPPHTLTLRMPWMTFHDISFVFFGSQFSKPLQPSQPQPGGWSKIWLLNKSAVFFLKGIYNDRHKGYGTCGLVDFF